MEDKNQNTGSSEENNGVLGLDVGTSRIVVADGSGDHNAKSQLNAFVSIPYSKMTETILQQNKMVYHRNGKDLYVYGNESERFASFFNTEPRRPMHSGVLNAQETRGQQIIQAIIEQLVPRARSRELVCFSVPGKGEGADANLVYHEAVIKSILGGLGYNAKAVNEGLAVVFAELQDENFTGIGISCGGGMCNVCVSFLSVPMLSFSIPKGGDYIDANVAAVVNESTTRVRLLKEESLDLARRPNDKVTSALHIYYEDVLQTLIDGLSEALAGSSDLPKLDRPIPIVLSGGTAKPRGFLQKFEERLRQSGDFPVRVADIRLAKDPLTATARGCYIAAMSEA
jgi:hypothetical protein